MSNLDILLVQDVLVMLGIMTYFDVKSYEIIHVIQFFIYSLEKRRKRKRRRSPRKSLQRLKVKCVTS